MNKIVVALAFFLFLGCSTKRKIVEKKLIGAKVEKIVEVQKVIEKLEKKDSVTQKKEVKTKIDQSTDLHIEFDPKKNDSLEVFHTNGLDSIFFKARGNGVVTFDFKKKKEETKTESHEIFGSETLYNIDSTVTEEKKETTEIKIEKSKKDKKETDFSFWIYVIIGGAVLVIIVLFWFFGKPKKY